MAFILVPSNKNDVAFKTHYAIVFIIYPYRVQIFDVNGVFVSSFGSYGQAPGELDCVSGIAVNTMGQIIVADRYNNRIQVFDR